MIRKFKLQDISEREGVLMELNTFLPYLICPYIFIWRGYVPSKKPYMHERVQMKLVSTELCMECFTVYKYYNI